MLQINIIMPQNTYQYQKNMEIAQHFSNGIQFSSSELLCHVEKIAIQKYGGHYCIFRFTTHYKGCLGAPIGSLYDILPKLKPFDKIDELLYYLIENEEEFQAWK